MNRHGYQQMATDHHDVFLRERELADRWKTSQRTLQRWRAAGCGPRYLHIGGAIRYRLRDVLDYEERMRRGGAAPEHEADE